MVRGEIVKNVIVDGNSMGMRLVGSGEEEGEGVRVGCMGIK